MKIRAVKSPECVLRELTSAGKIGKMRQTSRTASPYKSGPYSPSDTISRRTRSTTSPAFQPPSSVRQSVWPSKGWSSSSSSPLTFLLLSIPSDAHDLARRQVGGRIMINDKLESAKNVKIFSLLSEYLRRWLVTLFIFSFSRTMSSISTGATSNCCYKKKERATISKYNHHPSRKLPPTFES